MSSLQLQLIISLLLLLSSSSSSSWICCGVFRVTWDTSARRKLWACLLTILSLYSVTSKRSTVSTGAQAARHVHISCGLHIMCSQVTGTNQRTLIFCTFYSLIKTDAKLFQRWRRPCPIRRTILTLCIFKLHGLLQTEIKISVIGFIAFSIYFCSSLTESLTSSTTAVRNDWFRILKITFLFRIAAEKFRSFCSSQNGLRVIKMHITF